MDMKIIVSKTDKKAAFAVYFHPSEADKMVKFAESCGYKTSLTFTDERFKDVLSPFRKHTVRDIDWTDWRVYEKIITLMRQDKSYDAIVEALHSQSTGFAVQARCGEIYRIWDKFRDNLHGEPTQADLERWAKMIANTVKVSNKAVMNKIDRLEDEGCDVTGDKYPECKAGFNKNCFKCPHNNDAGKPIRDSTDLDRFNQVLKEEYEE